MMVDAGIGRVLVASLHQAIADVIPARLPFYEHWLLPGVEGDRRFGLASLNAVLSFLRREGQGTYDKTMIAAGRYSAEWWHAGLRPVQRRLVGRLPIRWRARAALALSRRMVKQTFHGTRARVRLRRGEGSMEIRSSVFCTLREPAGWPTCVFYSAAVERFLQQFELDARVDVSQCKASGGSECTMNLTIRGRRETLAAVEAA